MGERATVVVEELRRAGVIAGDLVSLASAPGVGIGVATPNGGPSIGLGVDDPSAAIRLVEDALRPRWVVWSNDTAATLAAAGTRIARRWDLAAVHRLMVGGWRADPARVGAHGPGLA